MNGASGTEVYQNVTITSGTTGIVSSYNAGSVPPCCSNTTGGSGNFNRVDIYDDNIGGQLFTGLDISSASGSTESPLVDFDINGTDRYINSDSSNNIDLYNTSGTLVDQFDSNGQILVEAPSGYSGNLINLKVNSTSVFSVDQAGDISINGHITTTGPGTPTVSALAGDGTSAPTPQLVSGSTDTAGSVDFGTGTGPIGSSDLIQVTFNKSYSVVPIVWMDCENWNCEHDLELGTIKIIADNISGSGFQIWTSTTPPASEAYNFFIVSYIVIGQ